MGNQAEWELPEDCRKDGMKYPYYTMVRSPAGTGYDIDDSKGHESLTLYHRSGSLIQMQPDGSIVVINKNNAYSVTFGDSNMLVTGAQNITVNGGGTLKVEGDYDVTVKGKMKTVVEGDSETIINGNATTAIKGNNEVAVGLNQTVEILGKSQEVAKEVNKGSTGSMLTSADGVHVIKGSRIDLNP